MSWSTGALEASGVEVRAGGAVLLDGVGLRAAPGEVVALVGPNGAGKSTLLSVLTGDVGPATGTVSLGGEGLAALSPIERARRRAVVTQHPPAPHGFRVSEVVGFGRAPWRGATTAAEDAQAIEGALSRCGIEHLAGRSLPQLSGGERALVALARALAQTTPVLLLDEPTAALDVGRVPRVFEVVRGHAERGGVAVVVVHDLTAAAAFADRVVLLHRGTVVGEGAPGSVLRPALLREAYGDAVDVVTDPRTGGPLILPRVRTGAASLR